MQLLFSIPNLSQRIIDETFQLIWVKLEYLYCSVLPSYIKEVQWHLKLFFFKLKCKLYDSHEVLEITFC